MADIFAGRKALRQQFSRLPNDTLWRNLGSSGWTQGAAGSINLAALNAAQTPATAVLLHTFTAASIVAYIDNDLTTGSAGVPMSFYVVHPEGDTASVPFQRFWLEMGGDRVINHENGMPRIEFPSGTRLYTWKTNGATDVVTGGALRISALG